VEPGTLFRSLVFLAVVAYGLLLVVSGPPSNWDSLTYHLARAAAWAQHGGVYWIDNAPTDRINEFQPLAEQENLDAMRPPLDGMPPALAGILVRAAQMRNNQICAKKPDQMLHSAGLPRRVPASHARPADGPRRREALRSARRRNRAVRPRRVAGPGP